MKKDFDEEMMDVFNTIINPDIEEEEKEKAEYEKKKEVQTPLDELKEATRKLQGFYNFDKALKLDVKVRLSSIFGVPIGNVNHILRENKNFYSVRWKHIQFGLIEVQTKEGPALVLDKDYQIYDEEGNLVQLTHLKTTKKPKKKKRFGFF